MMTGLECGHNYCTSCWTEYLSTKIMDEGASQMIECPGSNCDILVDDQTVMKLVKEAKVKLKYQQLITNSFVQVRFSPFFLRRKGYIFLKSNMCRGKTTNLNCCSLCKNGMK